MSSAPSLEKLFTILCNSEIKAAETENELKFRIFVLYLVTNSSEKFINCEFKERLLMIFSKIFKL